MGADAILRAIVDETERQVEALLADARRGAATIEADARQTARQRLSAAVAQAEPELAAEAARAVNLVRVQLLHRRAQVSAERLDAVFGDAGQRLQAIADDGDSRWVRALGRLACEAIATTGAGSTLRARPTDLAVLRGALRATGIEATLREDAGQPPGIVVRSADGRVEVDATLPVRLARSRSVLAERLAELVDAADG